MTFIYILDAAADVVKTVYKLNNNMGKMISDMEVMNDGISSCTLEINITIKNTKNY